MRRREFVVLLGGARSQRRSRPRAAADGHSAYRLPPAGAADPELDQTAFRQGLRDLGYVEGQNIIIDYRYAEGTMRSSPHSPPNWSAQGQT